MSAAGPATRRRCSGAKPTRCVPAARAEIRRRPRAAPPQAPRVVGGAGRHGSGAAAAGRAGRADAHPPHHHLRLDPRLRRVRRRAGAAAAARAIEAPPPSGRRAAAGRRRRRRRRRRPAAAVATDAAAAGRRRRRSRPRRVAPAPPPAAAPATVPRQAPPRRRRAPRARVDTDPDAAAIPARARRDRRPRSSSAATTFAGATRSACSGSPARQYIEARDLLAGVASDAPEFRDRRPPAWPRADARTASAGRRRLQGGGQARGSRATGPRRSPPTSGLRPYAASLPGLTEAVERTRKRMHEAGADALTRARQFDSRGRVPGGHRLVPARRELAAAGSPRARDRASSVSPQLVNRP